MGLICRRMDREIRRGEALPRERFVECGPQHGVLQRSGDLAVTAAHHALGGGLNHDPECGVCVTVSKGWVELLEAQVERGPNEGVPVLCCGADFAAQMLTRCFGLQGPSAAAVAACASGLACLKVGADWIRDGVCKAVLAGAAESSRSEMILSSFERLGVISKMRSTRPFDARRDGFVVGEGAGVFRLERLEEAERNARESPQHKVLGKILSVVLGADGHHLTAPDESGEALAGVIERALEGARKNGGRSAAAPEIGWVHAHGTGTIYNDRVEAAALRRVFGKEIPPVTATKGATGHLLGASGAVALGITLESLRDGVIPCICGTEEVAEEFRDLDLVLAQRKTTVRTALVLNHGFGGHLAAAVVAI